MRIEVTWGDILIGVRGHPYRCAMARAIRRAGIAEAAVGPRFISLDYPNSVPLPERALEFLWRFDGPFRLLRCRPFSFELNLPPPSETLQESRATLRAGIDVIGLGDVDCFVSTAKDAPK